MQRGREVMLSKPIHCNRKWDFLTLSFKQTQPCIAALHFAMLIAVYWALLHAEIRTPFCLVFRSLQYIKTVLCNQRFWPLDNFWALF